MSSNEVNLFKVICTGMLNFDYKFEDFAENKYTHHAILKSLPCGHLSWTAPDKHVYYSINV